MFSTYEPEPDENRPPYQPNQYPFDHIHPPTTARYDHLSPPRQPRITKQIIHAHSLPPPPPPVPTVRQLAGPRVQQEVGHGPFHTIQKDQKRFDFSKPKPQPLAANVSLINPPSSRQEAGSPRSRRRSSGGSGDAKDAANMIRMFRGSYAQNAQRPKDDRPVNVQSENNDPLSAHAHVILERFVPGESESRLVEATIQPQVSAKYIQRQTQQMLASKAEQLERYHREVQERLNRKIEAQKNDERKRRASLPAEVRKLVFANKSNKQAPDTETIPTSSSSIVASTTSTFIQPESTPSNQSLQDFLAQGSPSKHQQEHADRPATAEHPRQSSPSASTRPRPLTASGRTSTRAQLSKEESLAFLKQIRKQESQRSRELAQKARAEHAANPTASWNSGASTGRSSARSTGVAFGLGIYPRDQRIPSPMRETPRNDERDLIPPEQRNPNAFSVRQQRAQEEPPSPPEKVLHVPLPRGKTQQFSSAVGGRTIPKKVSTAPSATGSEKHSAYRRLVLERLHGLSQHLGHPLPPLCACGFTPKEEYELLFSYGGIPTSIVAPPVQQSQPPFNLSTVIAPKPLVDSSIHSSHAPPSSTANQTPLLASHVSLDSTRHGFQHKHNCQFYQQSESYVKALANLLHTLEDQQQI